MSAVSGYEVTARFSAIDGLKLGDDVRISGITVGTVVDQVLDPEYFQAIVHMSIKQSIELPEDTTAAVVSEGLLGGKYVATQPGGTDALIPPGGEITMTQSSVNLEGLLGKVIYNIGGAAKGAGG